MKDQTKLFLIIIDMIIVVFLIWLFFFIDPFDFFDKNYEKDVVKTEKEEIVDIRAEKKKVLDNLRRDAEVPRDIEIYRAEQLETLQGLRN